MMQWENCHGLNAASTSPIPQVKGRLMSTVAHVDQCKHAGGINLHHRSTLSLGDIHLNEEVQRNASAFNFGHDPSKAPAGATGDPDWYAALPSLSLSSDTPQSECPCWPTGSKKKTR